MTVIICSLRSLAGGKAGNVSMIVITSESGESITITDLFGN